MATKITAESFNRLLFKFSEDERQAAVAYTHLRDSLIRFFTLKGDSEPEAAADATLDRTAAKVAQNTPVGDIKKYSFGVARLIFLERRRFSQKEKIAAEDFYQGKTNASSDVENDDFYFFRECFKSLSNPDRTLLQNYFTDAPYQKIIETRHRLSDEKGFSINQLRVKISRLRKGLENCVRLKRKNN